MTWLTQNIPQTERTSLSSTRGSSTRQLCSIPRKHASIGQKHFGKVHLSPSARASMARTRHRVPRSRRKQHLQSLPGLPRYTHHVSLIHHLSKENKGITCEAQPEKASERSCSAVVLRRAEMQNLSIQSSIVTPSQRKCSLHRCEALVHISESSRQCLALHAKPTARSSPMQPICPSTGAFHCSPLEMRT